MDPFSITAGVVGLLATAAKVGSQLKKLIDGVLTANSAVSTLLMEVEDFSKVITLMNDTINELQKDNSPVGHIGSHWKNIATSIQDCRGVFDKLHDILRKVNKKVTVLDSSRRYLRKENMSAEIGIYQQQIRSYKDTMYWSVQVIILYFGRSHNMSFKRLTSV